MYRIIDCVIFLVCYALLTRNEFLYKTQIIGGSATIQSNTFVLEFTKTVFKTSISVKAEKRKKYVAQVIFLLFFLNKVEVLFLSTFEFPTKVNTFNRNVTRVAIFLPINYTIKTKFSTR